jgi:hypothetical protein
MDRFAELTVEGRKALLAGDHAGLADLMDANFKWVGREAPSVTVFFSVSSYAPFHFPGRLRRDIYGDDCLGSANLEMVRIAHKYNSVRRPRGLALNDVVGGLDMLQLHAYCTLSHFMAPGGEVSR